MKKHITLLLVVFFISLNSFAQETKWPDIPFFDTELSIEKRIDDLESRLTPKEKGNMITLWNKGVPRLGLQAFMPGEALHGLASPRHNPSTVFPQSIGLAATWNPNLINKIGDAVSDEARAQYHNGPEIQSGIEILAKMANNSKT